MMHGSLNEGKHTLAPVAERTENINNLVGFWWLSWLISVNAAECLSMGNELVITFDWGGHSPLAEGHQCAQSHIWCQLCLHSAWVPKELAQVNKTYLNEKTPKTEARRL
jgi:hypothetical protein